MQKNLPQDCGVEDGTPCPGESLGSPSFYAMQLYIAYQAVPWKIARNEVNLYALVGVCVLNSATSILSLAGISIEHIVAALEKHSSRYDVPGTLFSPRSLETEPKEKLSPLCSTIDVEDDLCLDL